MLHKFTKKQTGLEKKYFLKKIISNLLIFNNFKFNFLFILKKIILLQKQKYEKKRKKV